MLCQYDTDIERNPSCPYSWGAFFIEVRSPSLTTILEMVSSPESSARRFSAEEPLLVVPEAEDSEFNEESALAIHNYRYYKNTTFA